MSDRFPNSIVEDDDHFIRLSIAEDFWKLYEDPETMMRAYSDAFEKILDKMMANRESFDKLRKENYPALLSEINRRLTAIIDFRRRLR